MGRITRLISFPSFLSGIMIPVLPVVQCLKSIVLYILLSFFSFIQRKSKLSLRYTIITDSGCTLAFLEFTKQFCYYRHSFGDRKLNYLQKIKNEGQDKEKTQFYVGFFLIFNCH